MVGPKSATKPAKKNGREDGTVQPGAFSRTKFNIHHWQHILSQKKQNPTPAAVRSTAKKYQCNHCHSRFVHLSGLERHRSKFHGNGADANDAPLKDAGAVPVIKCVLCGVIFANADQYEGHSMCFDWEPLLAAQPPEAAYRLGAIFRNQQKIVAVSSVFVCEFCDLRFSDTTSLFYHEAMHDPADGYSCTFCQLNLPTLDSIVAHRVSKPEDFQREHGGDIPNVPNRYLCNVCVSSHDTLPKLYEHRYANNHFFPRFTRHPLAIARKEGRRRLLDRCPICAYLTNGSLDLVGHYQTNHAAKMPALAASPKDRPAADDGAGRKQTAVDQPSGGAAGTRPYLCEQCGKTYTQSSHLWQHLRFHNGVRPFVCPRSPCDRSFTIRPDLNDHIRKCHTGERPYKCETCDKRFLTGSVYYQHRLIHRGERRYACPDCDKRFYRADALKNHQRIHSGERPYACGMCERKFRQRGDREKHVRVKHMRIR